MFPFDFIDTFTIESIVSDEITSIENDSRRLSIEIDLELTQHTQKEQRPGEQVRLRSIECRCRMNCCVNMSIGGTTLFQGTYR
jgi:hypothetical protein